MFSVKFCGKGLSRCERGVVTDPRVACQLTSRAHDRLRAQEIEVGRMRPVEVADTFRYAVLYTQGGVCDAGVSGTITLALALT